MRYSREDPGFDRVATIDIETTHYDAAQGETVSIGLGVHDCGTPAEGATYETFHRDGDGEGKLVERAYRRLDALGADGLVTYNGRGFDLEFLEDRLSLIGEAYTEPELDAEEVHIDLYEGRKAKADRQGEKWPSLEETIESYEWTPATTIWGGSPLTNERFGEELGPAYLRAVAAEDESRRASLTETIEHYLVTDLEANFAVYYGDIGEEFDPVHLGSTATFEVR